MTKDYTASVASRLRATRESMGLNQPEFAKLGGVKRATQLSYESGARYPDTKYFENLLRNGVDIEQIIAPPGAADSLNPPPHVMQRIFMLSAGIDDAQHPNVVLFQSLCVACTGSADVDKVDRIHQTLELFRQSRIGTAPSAPDRPEGE